MKSIHKKMLAAVLTASMLLPVVSCRKGRNKDSKSRSGQKISEDSPWFESTVRKYDLGLVFEDPIWYINNQAVDYDDDHLIIETEGQYEEQIEGKYSQPARYIDFITVVDRHTQEVISQVDLTKNKPVGDIIDEAKYENGIITVKYGRFSSLSYTFSYYEKDIDAKTGEILETRDLGAEEKSYSSRHTVNINGYEIEQTQYQDMSNYLEINIKTPDGLTKKFELRDDNINYYIAQFFSPVSEKEMLFPVVTDDGFLFYEIDLTSMTLIKLEKENMDWLDLRDSVELMCFDEKIYNCTNKGFSVVDFKNKTVKQIFDYSWCGANRNILAGLMPEELSEDRIVLMGFSNSNGKFSLSSQFEFWEVELKKSDKNPHAGKQVLELYIDGRSSSEAIADAILKFNDTNADYYIEVTNRYDEDRSYLAGFWSIDDALAQYNANDHYNIKNEDDLERLKYSRGSELSDSLAFDIINGDGPDILMNVSQYGQLNNSDYLADLTPYIGNLAPDKYYTNIIDCSKVDGRLYQIPICYKICGIQTNEKYIGASGTGFTTGEYEAFLRNSDTLNGTDIITVGQPYYFARLFNAMSEKFIKNGKVDLSAPEFKILADYVRDNVPEKGRKWDDNAEDITVVYGASYNIIGVDFLNDHARLSACSGLKDYIENMAKVSMGTAFAGIPSTDGRGPVIEPNISVAVSSQALDVDACGEFVKLLMAEEIQERYALDGRFVLSRNALRKAGAAAIEYYNGAGGHNLFGVDQKSFIPLKNEDRYKFSTKNIDDVEKIILSCSTMNNVDPAIDIILIEEMPPYFLGQKDLDSVIKIAQDRAQKVLDERRG